MKLGVWRGLQQQHQVELSPLVAASGFRWFQFRSGVVLFYLRVTMLSIHFVFSSPGQDVSGFTLIRHMLCWHYRLLPGLHAGF